MFCAVNTVTLKTMYGYVQLQKHSGREGQGKLFENFNNKIKDQKNVNSKQDRNERTRQ